MSRRGHRTPRDAAYRANPGLCWLDPPVIVPRTRIQVVGYDSNIDLPEWIAEASEALGDDDRAL